MTPSASIAVTRDRVRIVVPSCASWRAAACESERGYVGRMPVTELDEEDLRLLGVDGPEIVGQGIARDLAERSGKLDPGGTRADDDEGHERVLDDRVALVLGGLEGAEDAGADLERVLDRLQAGCVTLPAVLVEVGMARPGRDDERVVRERLAVSEADLASFGVDVDGLAEDDPRVLLVPEDVAQRLGDLGRRQRPGRDLVEQRREDVMVAPVQQRRRRRPRRGAPWRHRDRRSLRPG